MEKSVSTVYYGTTLFAANIIKSYGIWIDIQSRLTDFGKGFYVTFNNYQALKWARVKAHQVQIPHHVLERLGITVKEYIHHPYSRIPAIMKFQIDTNLLKSLSGIIFPSTNHPLWP
ncbi:DUF3990 domain-containing protein [Alkalihalobacillus sp. TS-13]|uniref:DUF3990 domain-containing protein n=1 Tax=Alkalihalobacillus sp. TS-13 TaxID=2842455 RepID=UPI001C868E38|nr:DUF3990 domain-containing protein [Alkalihalobacillus sp. TS-13]